MLKMPPGTVSLIKGGALGIFNSPPPPVMFIQVIRTWRHYLSMSCLIGQIFQEGSPDEMTKVTNDYIHFCVQLVVPTKKFKSIQTM